MIHLEYFVYAILAIATILLGSAIAIFFPYLRREARADAAQTRELHAKATDPEHESAH